MGLVLRRSVLPDRISPHSEKQLCTDVTGIKVIGAAHTENKGCIGTSSMGMKTMDSPVSSSVLGQSVFANCPKVEGADGPGIAVGTDVELT